MFKKLSIPLMVIILLTACNTVKQSSINRSAYKEFPYDAIIVPGVPYYHDSISSVLQARIKWSIFLYKNGLTKNIIYSGADVHTPYIESKVMGLIAMQNGIPAEAIYYDTIAQHGTENIYYSYVLAKKYGFERVALATDPFQSALLAFFRLTMKKKFKIKGGIPNLDAEIKDIKEVELDLTNIPDSLAYNPEHIPIYQKKTPSEIFFGSIGGNIPWGN